MAIFSIISWLKTLDDLRHRQIFMVPVSTLQVASGLNKTALKVALHRLQNKGFLIRLGRRWVILPEAPLWKAVPIVWAPTYLSLEWALHFHDVVDQEVFTVTAVTRGRPQTLETPMGNVRLHHIKKDLFFGFNSQFIAFPEKALLDTVYIRRRLPDGELNLEFLDVHRLESYIPQYPIWVRNLLQRIVQELLPMHEPGLIR